MKRNYVLFSTILGALLTACNQVEPETPAPVASPQIENNIAKDSETPISAGSLSGLYRNAGPDSPVILIVPGSGPTDLNGNSPFGISASPYQRLAKALSEKGISTVRVDKRGMFSSAKAGEPNAVTVDIYAQDYQRWVDIIRTETERPCVYILGHSEGALMVSAASVGNEHVCGLILVAGIGRRFGDVLREQLKANPANGIIIDEALGIIETLERGERADTTNMHAALRPLFGDHVQDFMISFMQTEPAQLAKSADKDTLIIQGRNDLQVSILDAEKLAEATSGKLIIIDGMNHVLKNAPENRIENIATYSNPDLPLSDGVAEAIRDFVNP